MKAQSILAPDAVQDLGNGTYLENTNIQVVTIVDEFGQSSIVYEYDSELKHYPVVPYQIAAYRLRSWAIVTGINDDIEAFFESLDPATATFALGAWRGGAYIERHSHILDAYINQSATLTHEQVDQIFIDLYNLPL